MSGGTITTISNMLKDIYLGPISEQLNNETLILARLETRTQDFVGNQVVLPLHTGRSGGVGARGEDQDLPAAGNQVYKRAVYDTRNLYGRLRVTGPSMMKSRNDAGSFIPILRGEIDGLRQDLKRDLARQFYGSGDGKVATCGTTTTSATVVLSSSEPIDKGYLYPGLPVNIGTASNVNSLISGEAIVSVDASTPSITVSTSISTTSSDFVFIAGSTADDSTAAGGVYEVDGLQKMVATSGAVGGLNPATAGEEFWASMSISASGGNVALDDFQQAFNRSRLAGGEISAILTSFGVQRKYFNLLQSQVRYMDPQVLRGGFQVLEHMGKPIIADRDAPWGKAFFLDEQYIKVYSPQDWHFLDEDGHTLKWVTGRDAWEAVLARYLNLGTNRRNTHVIYDSITDTTGY